MHDNPWWKVFFDEVLFPNGVAGRHMRLAPTSGKPGVVVLAIRNGEKGREIAFVTQYRYAADSSMLELPRGFAESSDVDVLMSAAREFSEETGLSVGDVKVVGQVFPDSSIIAVRVAICVVEVERSLETGVRDGEVDDVLWIGEAQVRNMVLTGELTDGFSLAALAHLWATTGQILPMKG